MDMDTDESPDDQQSDKDSEFSFSPSGEFLDSNGKHFEFAYYSSDTKNQKRYEKIGNAVTEHIYKVMESKFDLMRINIPGTESEESLDQDFGTSFVFMSKNFQHRQGKKLILINGSGAVRAGQWARKIIVNDNLHAGSMLPYIEWALQNEFGILVLNTNESGPNLKGSETPFEHAETAWNKFLSHVSEKSVFIVAHSFGGIVTQKIASKYEKFDKVVAKIAFTDSVHMGPLHCNNIPIINWITSDAAVNNYLGEKNGCELRSAGTQEHAWTSHCAINHIFDWFLETGLIKSE